MIKCKLNELIEQRGVTQTEIANATGISRPTLLSLIKNDAQGIKFSSLEKLCELFNVTISEFLISDKEIIQTKDEQLDKIINMARQLKSGGN